MKHRNRRHEDRLDERAFLILKYVPIVVIVVTWAIAALVYFQ
jgi:hypothetical protein